MRRLGRGTQLHGHILSRFGKGAAQRGCKFENFFDQVPWKAVMSRFDGRVRRKQALGPALRQRFLKFFASRHFLAHELQRQERGVPFVHMEN